MSKRNNSVAKGTSYLLIYLTAIQPLHPAIAAGITPDNNHTQVQNQGNVPVVNIATPNNAGISHNTYKEFNIATQGAVLNNATQAAKSQLAGQLNANPNLHGKAAELIINEVTGSGRSHLQGQLEIFGNKANVMIANPNGITCDGCGFINTSSATLTTGKPQFDKQGALEALKVTKGQITIGGKGLDGKATDYVDIISRATELNGKIQANNLSLTQGANRISLKDGTVKPIAGEGTKPQLAIDTKALGGMYANKIRLVATEDGVGVNLKELTSNQRDITLNANGKIELGNIKAKTDLNIIGKETHIAPNINVQAGRDITLANTMLDNKGNVTTGRDMRIFGDTVRNSGNKAFLQANNNMWIQKDAQGNKGRLVENRSATIKTVNGDLVIRTKELNNIRDEFITEWKIETPYSNKIEYLGFEALPGGQIKAYKPKVNKHELNKWFDYIDINKNDWVNVGRKELILKKAAAQSVISSGKNLFSNTDRLLNKTSLIKASKSIFLTGTVLQNISGSLGGIKDFIKLSADFDPEKITDNGRLLTLQEIAVEFPLGEEVVYDMFESESYDDIDDSKAKFKKTATANRWKNTNYNIANIIAGEDLVSDFKDSIDINTIPLYDAKKTSEIESSPRPEALAAKNILLNAKQINVTDNNLKAANKINLLANDNINIKDGSLLAGGDLSMVSVNDINAIQGQIKGNNITIISRNADLNFKSSETLGYFNPDGTRKVSSLESAGDLSLNAGKDILLRNMFLSKNQNISLVAGNNITIDNNSTLLTYKRMGDFISHDQKQAFFNQLLPKTGKLDAKNSVIVNSGGNLSINGVNISAGKNIHLTSAKNIGLNFLELSSSLSELFPSSRSAELSSRLTAGNNISIISGSDINGKAAQINAKGNTLLSAGSNITLPSLAYSAINKADYNNKDDRHITAQIRGDKKLTIAANGAITTAGSKLTSGGDVILSSGGNMRFQSVQNHTYRENGSESTESVTQNGTELTSGGILTVLSNGSILFQATKLAAKGAMDVAAKGGYLYAQAMEESNHYEKTETKRRWYGKKKTTTRTRHDVTNKVTEFTAGGDINLLSRDDSTYEASKIATNKNAKLTSTHGKVNFKAVKNSTFEQTITHSKGFYIKQTNKGYTENKWVLPAIHIGGKFTVEAAKGVSADIKVKNGQSLQNAVSVFGNTPETAWLKGLNERKDVQWNLVKDAYDSWDYKSQHLNPVVSAVIAIAVAAATAGAGLTVSVAGSAASTAGSAATAAGATASTAAAMSSVAYSATASGMAALASQAAVALVDNQGDLSKTLKVLGSSDTVKSTVTSMAIGGALAGFDNVMGWDKAANGAQIDPAKATLPKLSNGDWSKVAQRVAGQSIISSSLGTAINGGSFKDNFTTALLANIGSQINAEGAGLIGKNGQVLGLPGKAISHAAVSALAAEIGGGDAKGAAAGALAAELAAITLDKTFNDPMKIQAGGKIIGSVAGAIATNSAKGANSGANAGEIVILFNHLNSMNVYNLVRELQEANKQGTPTEAIWNKYNKLSATQRAEMLSHCAGNGGLCTLTYQAEMDGGIKTADAISGLRWMFGLSEEDSHRISQFVTTENQNDLGLLYNSLPAWEKGALIAKEAVESVGIGGAIGSKASVASIVGKSRHVGNTIGSSKTKETQIWTETKKKEPVANAYGHWDKHKSEFPEYQNSKQYVEATHNFIKNPPKGTLIKTRANGDTLYYNPKTNIFAVKNVDGVPKTMFKPNPVGHGYETNLDYFNAQK
ncbi:DUF637 domain-containing protein [Photorhabdus caribbeanensis]|uniref:DUF637 domain-containing protein n=1 Tax=Photorhabdus caribbeanensis TaxID=1004165 RepID=UPI001BD28535|nr:DUF637 domain-containing protein [Photorhabdus caribbeanensis]MBS9422656.1 filamentous hemagglutinin N-terminal domain-containing protein [Photorhabdus caribbeanensis]